MGIPRERRITTRREIGRLLSGSRVRGRHLELFWTPGARRGRSRAGCITPKFGHGTVERNRLRRRLKELVRHRLLARFDDRDFLVRARPSAYGLPFEALRSELERLVGRLETEHSDDAEES
ncbi:MAG: ribonuclease P protein component [Gemmatimonadota bacterium]|nr:ribonuclease P protein component [Gemmatimonadota bacterium]